MVLHRSVSPQRWIPLLVALGTLAVMGFYAITNDHSLTHNTVLGGADWVGYAVCHRITERSFTINGRQFPLCARCTGMYLGAALTVVVLWLAGRVRHAELPPLPVLVVLIGFIGLMGIDGLNSYSHFFPSIPHLYEPRNWLRLLTGMGTGLAMGAILLPALAQTVWKQVEIRPSLGSFRELADLLLVAGAVTLLVLSNQPTLLYVLALASVAGLLFIVTAVNTMLLLILLRRDGRGERWLETAVPLLAGLLLALLEIGTASFLRYHFTGTMVGFPGL